VHSSCWHDKPIASCCLGSTVDSVMDFQCCYGLIYGWFRTKAGAVELYQCIYVSGTWCEVLPK